MSGCEADIHFSSRINEQTVCEADEKAPQARVCECGSQAEAREAPVLCECNGHRGKRE